MARSSASMWKRPKNPDDWQQIVYAVSHHLPGPIRRVFRQEIFWKWLYPVWWRYKFYRILSPLPKWGEGQGEGKKGGSHRYITIIPGPDGGTAGIGDQLSKWNTALVLALKYNLKLAHHPFVRWWNESGWDEFLGFGVGERPYADVMADLTIKKIWLPPLDLKYKREEREKFVATIITKLYPQDNVLFHLGDGTNLYDHSSTGPWLREKYWKARAKNPVTPLRPTGFAGQASLKLIALHIRRGDLVDMKRSNTKVWQQRWLDNNYFVKVVKQVQEAINNAPNEVHVYSEGQVSDFPEFAGLKNVVWHLNEDLKQAWHGFITADILITSPSSLSYHAGFLNTEVKIAVYPWWHYIPDGGGWVRSTREGKLDLNKLKQAVQ